MNTSRLVGSLAIALLMAGCVPREIVREVIVPARIPSLCTTDCPVPEGIPATNGELAESWASRGEALACYRARMACVREMTDDRSGRALRRAADPAERAEAR
jgi:hypothetical protein